MRIRCKFQQDPINLFNTPVASLEDCEITTDSGEPIEGILAFEIRALPGMPVVCHITTMVTEIDVDAQACPETLRGGDPDDRG